MKPSDGRCETSTGPDDQYGIAYDYRDQMAQATCTALLDTTSAHVYAVRRTCSNLTVPCAEVCSSLRYFPSCQPYAVFTLIAKKSAIVVLFIKR
ncbi:hypothetical protein MAR_015364 [Mya arenaria]|uniref:Uncharacterized protein n=1 Tax=Mya arenaria TaxID=6604 RepID=A0ABY7FH48_MYAAR|nr:hypothetical protein MAR_015364 [Mya arenaria]